MDPRHAGPFLLAFLCLFGYKFSLLGLPFSHLDLNFCWQFCFLFPVGVYVMFKNSSVHDYLIVSLRFFLSVPHCSFFCLLSLTSQLAFLRCLDLWYPQGYL